MMKTRRLGRSAMVVSEICMGTMTFGNQADEAMSHRILDQSFEAGITFYDTAENYPVPPDEKYAGLTEEIVGRWMKTKKREQIILATKVSGPSHGWIRSAQRSGMTALDRHNIVRAVEASLDRLQTDYIDLYQTHWPDHAGPYDEVVETLDELVRSGKVRAVGCSNETAWGLMKSLAASERLGAARCQSIQNNFSLNNRRFEDELAQVCRQEGVSLIPYSPLAGGVLTGKYQGGARPEGARFSNYLQIGRPPGPHGRALREREVAGLGGALHGDRQGAGDQRHHPGGRLEQAARLRRLDHRRRYARGPAAGHLRRGRRDARARDD